MSKLPDNTAPMRRFTGASDDPILEGQLHALLEHLYSLHIHKIDLSLNRTYRFLERVGNPHLHLPKVVHIAGTNGKGSTTATLRALLEQAGRTVHSYTSPHLIHPTERINLAGSPITSQALFDILTECIEINNAEPITFFELTSCAALLLFARIPADYVILETGMGGRMDPTNVVPAPVATIITTISYDHMAFLGTTLPQIAAEKAGIMKSGVPCVIGKQTQEAMEAGVLEVFHKTSQELSTKAPLHRFGAEWSSAPESDKMLFRYGNDSIALQKPSLLGIHQIWNAGAALEAFRLIEPMHFRADILSPALGQIRWPGRLQILKNHPLNRLVPHSWDIILDGAHNDSGAQMLALQMEEWHKNDSKPCHVVMGLLARKDPKALLEPLRPYATSLTFIPVEDGDGDSHPPEYLAQTARTLGFQDVRTTTTPEDALKMLSQQPPQSPVRVLIAGSLYLVGNILGKTDQ